MMRAARPVLAFAVAWILCSCASLAPDVGRTSSSYSRYLKGLFSDRMGDAREAARFFAATRQADAQAAAPHRQLGFQSIGQGDHENAAREFENVVRLSPDDDNARYVLALLYAQLNDHKRSIAQYSYLLERSLDNRSQNIQLRRILSQLYFLDGDLASAAAQCSEILKLDALDAWGLYFRAVIDNEEGRIQQAIAGFKEVLGYYPDWPEPMNSLAYLYAEQETALTQALVLIERAMEFDPANGAYLDTAGWIHYKIGDLDRALDYLKRASKLEIDAVILRHLGDAYSAKGMAREAKEAWESSLRLDPRQKDLREKIKSKKP